MKITTTKVCKNITNIYFWCTILGEISLIVLLPISFPLLAVGANSVYLALGYCGFSDSIILARFSLFWLVAFPITFVISFVYTVKKQRYGFFFVVMLADTVFECFSVILELLSKNNYGFERILPGAILSVVLCIVFLFFVTRQRAGGGNVCNLQS